MSRIFQTASSFPHYLNINSSHDKLFHTLWPFAIKSMESTDNELGCESMVSATPFQHNLASKDQGIFLKTIQASSPMEYSDCLRNSHSRTH